MKASRSGQAILRFSSTRSSSRKVKGGKAPGKLAVARAAAVSPGTSPSLFPAGLSSRKCNIRRCSSSVTRGGLLSASGTLCPAKSVTDTNRSTGCPSGTSTGPRGPASIASNASSSRFEKVSPPNGGSNQRARTKRDSLARTSSCAPSPTVRSIALPRFFIIQPAIGTAQNLVAADSGRASGSISLSTSASSSHRSVNGSSDCPVASARARKMPLMPPALAPATMSASTRSRTLLRAAISVSSS